MSSLYGAGRFYGEDGFLYGQDPFGLEFSTARFVAFPVGYGRLRVEWTLPSGDDWTELRIVRSAGGWAEVVSEGLVLVDVPRASSQRVLIDEGLDTSRFYYYTMFVLVFGAWVPVARTEGLSVHDHAFQDRFYTKYLPETYQDSDESTGYALRRTIEAFAEAADYIRSETSTLLELRNPDRVPAQLLYLQAADFGLAYEADLGSIRMRRIIRDAVYIYKRKGSLRGIQALATAVTGWAAEVSYDHAEQEAVIDFQAERVNLAPNPSFEVDLAGWDATGATTSRVAGGYVGSWHVLLEGTGPTAVFATDVLDLSPEELDAFYLYWGQVRLFSDTDVSVEPRLVWHLDGGGTTTVAGDVASTGTGGDVEELDDWVHASVSASTPSEVVGVALELHIAAPGAFELHVDAASIERAYDLPEYFDATTEVGGMWGDDPHGSTSYFYSRRLVRQRHLFRLLRQHLPEDVTPRLRYGQPKGLSPNLLTAGQATVREGVATVTHFQLEPAFQDGDWLRHSDAIGINGRGFRILPSSPWPHGAGEFTFSVTLEFLAADFTTQRMIIRTIGSVSGVVDSVPLEGSMGNLPTGRLEVTREVEEGEDIEFLVISGSGTESIICRIKEAQVEEGDEATLWSLPGNPWSTEEVPG